MSVNFRTDYEKMYPGVEIPADVLDFLKKSDMEMEYQEHGRKRSRIRKNTSGEVIEKPSLECSLEYFMEIGCPVPGAELSAEDEFFSDYDGTIIRRCVSLLDQIEREVIEGLYFKRLTIRDCATLLSLSKSTADRYEKKALAKLKLFIAEMRD